MNEPPSKLDTIGRMLQSCGCIVMLVLILIPLIVVLLMWIRAA